MNNDLDDIFVDLKKMLDHYAKRCPQCKGTNFTSSLRGSHKCFDCGTCFADETALPSQYREEKNDTLE